MRRAVTLIAAVGLGFFAYGPLPLDVRIPICLICGFVLGFYGSRWVLGR